jgi:putative tryptophan/tyrosine transport system substrate-binding protein
VLAAVRTPTYTEFPMVRCYRSHRFAQERPPLESEMTVFLERRKCLALLGGVLVSSLVARAQALRVRRIGVLIYGGEDSRGSQAQVAALRDGLKELGWVEDRNLRMEIRFDSDSEGLRAHAEALVSQLPDVIVVSTNAATKALQQQTQIIPIVFAGVGDPVVNGLVATLARPDGNITGVTNLFYSIGGKWLKLLKEVAPRLATVAVVFNPELTTAQGWFAAIEAAAAIYGVKAIRVPARNPAEIEDAIGRFAREPNGGLIVVPPGLVGAERDMVFRQTLQRRLPAIYQAKAYALDGGLMSYGADAADLFRQSSALVDRILRGAKPRELPVQVPTKFELVINLKAAKAIGLD